MWERQRRSPRRAIPRQSLPEGRRCVQRSTGLAEAMGSPEKRKGHTNSVGRPFAGKFVSTSIVAIRDNSNAFVAKIFDVWNEWVAGKVEVEGLTRGWRVGEWLAAPGFLSFLTTSIRVRKLWRLPDPDGVWWFTHPHREGLFDEARKANAHHPDLFRRVRRPSDLAGLPFAVSHHPEAKPCF